MAARASGRRRLAGRDHDGTGRHVRAAQAHVVSRLDRAVEGDVIAVGMRELYGHDAVGAGGQRRAGRDRHGRVRLETGRVVACERPARHEELAGRIDRPHGVSVHRRVVERRQVVGGVHVGRHDAAGERARELERLGRQRREALEQERTGLVREQRTGIGGGHGPML